MIYCGQFFSKRLVSLGRFLTEKFATIGTQRWVSVCLLGAVLLVNSMSLYPELAVSRVDLNDNVFHYGLAQGFVESIEAHENPFNHWYAQWGFGYRLLRTYQPLPTALVASAYFALAKHVDLMTVFVWVRYLALVLLPASFYGCAWLFGLGDLGAAAATVLSPLISSPGLYGIEYGSFVWAGSGLFTQLIAVHFFLWTIGFAMRGRWRIAGDLLALTFLSHFMYGLMGAMTITLLRPKNAWKSGLLAAALCSFQLWMLWTDHALINHSRWEPAWKWSSFGMSQIVTWLVTGELLDHGRLPVLSLLALTACLAWRHNYPLNLIAGFWLVAYFGWSWLDFLPQHRFIGAVQVFLVLLAAVGLSQLWTQGLGKMGPVPVFLLTGLLLFPMLSERAQYLRNNAEWGAINRQAYEQNEGSINAALAIAKARGGRGYAGLPATWGGAFKVGSVPFYAFLSIAEIPSVGMLYHSMSKPSDNMYLFDERKLSDYRLCNVRTVIAPRGKIMAPFLKSLGIIGPFELWAVP